MVHEIVIPKYCLQSKMSSFEQVLYFYHDGYKITTSRSQWPIEILLKTEFYIKRNPLYINANSITTIHSHITKKINKSTLMVEYISTIYFYD